jgi:hypothetical protein
MAPLSAVANTVRPGDKIGYSVFTDIICYINGTEIPAWNYNGWMYAIVDDLPGYGFNLRWDGAKREAHISFGTGIVTNPTRPTYGIGRTGSRSDSVHYTDIRVFVDGTEVESYLIQGKLVMGIRHLNKFGRWRWDPAGRMTTLDMFGHSGSTSIRSNRWDGFSEADWGILVGTIHHTGAVLMIDDYPIPSYQVNTVVRTQEMIGGALTDVYTDMFRSVIALDDLQGYGFEVVQSGANHYTVLPCEESELSPKNSPYLVSGEFERFYDHKVNVRLDYHNTFGFRSHTGRIYVPFQELAVFGVMDSTSQTGDVKLTTRFDITGIIHVDTHTLPGINVQLQRMNGTRIVKVWDTVTDSAGRYSFDTLLTGIYRIAITSSSSVFYSARIVLQGDDQEFNFRVQAVRARVSGTVRAGTSFENQLVPAKVRLLGTGNTVVSEVTATALGQYRFDDVPVGTYTLEVSHQGYVTQTFAVNLGRLGHSQDVLLRKEGLELTGRVVDTSWWGSGAMFTVTLSAGGTIVQTTLASFNGDYSFEGLTPGTYQMTVTASNFLPHTVTVNLNQDRYGFNVFVSRPQNLITGVLRGDNGQVLANTRIDIVDALLSGVVIRTVTTDSEGRYQVDLGAFAGSYFFRITTSSGTFTDPNPIIINSNGTLTGGSNKDIQVSNVSTVRVPIIWEGIPSTARTARLIIRNADSSVNRNEEMSLYATPATMNLLPNGTYTVQVGVVYVGANGRDATFLSNPVTLVISSMGVVQSPTITFSNFFKASVTAELDFRPVGNIMMSVQPITGNGGTPTGSLATHRMTNGAVVIDNLVNGWYRFSLVGMEVLVTDGEPIDRLINHSDVEIKWFMSTLRNVAASGMIEGIDDITNVSSMTLRLTGEEFRTIPVASPYAAYVINTLRPGNYSLQATAIINGTSVVSSTEAFTVKAGENTQVAPLRFNLLYSINATITRDGQNLTSGFLNWTPLDSFGGTPINAPARVPIQGGRAIVPSLPSGFYRLEITGITDIVRGNDIRDIEVRYADVSTFWDINTVRELDVSGYILGLDTVDPEDTITRVQVTATGPITRRVDVGAPYDSYDLGELPAGNYTIRATAVINGITVTSTDSVITIQAGRPVAVNDLEFDFTYRMTVQVLGNGVTYTGNALVSLQKLQGLNGSGGPDPMWNGGTPRTQLLSAGSTAFPGLDNGWYELTLTNLRPGESASPMTLRIHYQNAAYFWQVVMP